MDTREAPTPPRLPPLRPTLVLVGRLLGMTLAAAVVGLALLEGVLRLFGLPEGVGTVRAAYDLDGETPGVYKAGGRIFVAWPPEVAFQAHFNSFGCRGPEPKLGDAPPILAIGHSYTFGFGVRDDETWPAALEQRLREQGIQRAVLNCASPRLTIEDQIHYVRQVLPVLKPDIVIIFPAAEGGDPLDHRGRTPHQRIVDSTRERRKNWIRPAIRSLAISEARFVSSHWRHQLVAEGRGEYPPMSRDRPTQTASEPNERYERGVAEAKALVEAHGARLVLVSLPSMGSQDGKVLMADPGTERTARELGVPYVDLFAAYSRSPDPNALFLLPYDQHASPLGHELTADAVLALLYEAGLLD